MEVVNIGVADQSVALPIEKKALADFISGLLGQPQSISRRFEEAFSADHQWFVHFFSLILQRIQQQNSPEPLSFEATISYKDKVERKITSWQAFQHFSETQNIVSVGVQFNLALLIHFPTKEIPERQELIIRFDAANRRKIISFFELIMGDSATTGGVITVEVRHTERTWADDILRLIETEISNIQVPDLKLRIYLRKVFGPLATFLFPIMMFGSVVYTQWSADNDGLREKAAKLIKVGDTSLPVLHDKINILILEAGKRSSEVVGSFKIFLYSLLIAALVFIVGKFLAQPNPSFVVLSNAAERNRTQTLERLKRRGLLLSISTVISVVLGVAGNFIYDYVK